MNSKKELQRRMVRKKATNSRITKLRQRKISVGNDDDDSSVDSSDNLKNFIVESESESESEKRPSKKSRAKNDEAEEESEEESEARDTDEEEEEGGNAIRINFGGFGQKPFRFRGEI